MSKSADAFRTISEVAEWLDLQTHVLRFWESKFSQVKPVKRAGGRRYYRPNDMLLLGGIKKLLHEDGMTIKGVQKTLRENGVKHVASLSAPLDSAKFAAEPPSKSLPQDETPASDAFASVAAAHEPEPEPELTTEGASVALSKAEDTASKPELPGVPDTSETATPEPETQPEMPAHEAKEPEEDLSAPGSLSEDSAEDDAPAETVPDKHQPEAPASSALPAFLQPPKSADDAEVRPALSAALTSDAPASDPTDEQIDAPAGLLSRLAALRRPLRAELEQTLSQARKDLTARL